jgi:hypothetical protein
MQLNMLKFDTQRLTNDFLDAVDKELDIVAQHAVEYMQQEISQIPNGPHYASRWNDNVKNAIKYTGMRTATSILKKVGIIDQDNLLVLNQALATNYGIGSTLSTDNPYLEEFEQSEYFNKARKSLGYTIVTRPGQYVYDYDLGTWYQSRAKSVYTLDWLYQYPSYFFENAMKLVQDEYDRVLERVFDRFDFSKYLITDSK